ncbi:MAG: DUF6036 family nucleotidyltransferase [Thermoanaerobaculia bacterium]
MRRVLDQGRLQEFLKALGRESKDAVRVYLTGGATAVLYGWRDTTIDIDLKIVPDSDRLLQSIPRLKEAFEVNVELASPSDFIPELPGWQERSPLLGQEGAVSFHHYDFYSQALAKLERGHAKDLEDVRQLLRRGLVDRELLRRFFDEIEPKLYRYPAIDPASFRRAVEEFLRGQVGA